MSLRKLCHDKGLTLKTLAQKTYISSRTLENWDNQSHLPRLNNLALLAQALDVSVDELAKSLGYSVLPWPPLLPKKTLKELFISTSQTQQQIAKQIQVNSPTLSLWSNGKTYPTLDKALALAAVLNISLNDLAIAFDLLKE